MEPSDLAGTVALTPDGKKACVALPFPSISFKPRLPVSLLLVEHYRSLPTQFRLRRKKTWFGNTYLTNPLLKVTNEHEGFLLVQTSMNPTREKEWPRP